MTDPVEPTGLNEDIFPDDANRLLFQAVLTNDLKLLVQALNDGAGIDSTLDYEDVEGATALMHASSQGHIAVMELLLEAGADATLVDLNGDTALWRAVRSGQNAAVKVLVAVCDDINAVNCYEKTMLILSTELGYTAVVESLVLAGASVDLITDAGQGPALCVASREGHAAVVKKLLELHADVNCVGRDRLTPVMAAVIHHQVDVVDVLIAAGANLEAPYDLMSSPLLIASTDRDVEMVRKLVWAGADPHAGSEYRESAWQWIIDNSEDEVEMLNILLEAGVDDNYEFDPGYTTLCHAASYGLEVAVKTLLQAGADVHRMDSTGQNTLSYAENEGHSAVVDMLLGAGAVRYVNEASDSASVALLNAAMIPENTERVETLLASGIDIDQTESATGHTALHVACRQGCVEIAEMLINAGADVSCTDNSGNTPLIEATRRHHVNVVDRLLAMDAPVDHMNRSGETALIVAVKENHKAIVDTLIAGGASVHGTASRLTDTPRMIACRGNLAVVRTLIAAGAGLNRRNYDDDTPLTKATGWQQTEIISELVVAGVDVNQAGRDGHTPLMLAALSGNGYMAEMLLTLGADVFLESERGRTAKDLA